MEHESLDKYYEERPWGSFTQFIKNTPATVKIISVRSGSKLSLQKHAKRSEFWKILSGEGFVIINDKQSSAIKNDEFFVPQGAIHRIGASTDMEILEIALGEFDENDIIRLEDEYGRTQ